MVAHLDAHIPPKGRSGDTVTRVGTVSLEGVFLELEGPSVGREGEQHEEEQEEEDR